MDSFNTLIYPDSIEKGDLHRCYQGHAGRPQRSASSDRSLSWSWLCCSMIKNTSGGGGGGGLYSRVHSQWSSASIMLSKETFTSMSPSWKLKLCSRSSWETCNTWCRNVKLTTRVTSMTWSYTVLSKLKSSMILIFFFYIKEYKFYDEYGRAWQVSARCWVRWKRVWGLVFGLPWLR